MKILTIPEQHDIDIGVYSPACEGFIDTLKNFFDKDKDRKERVRILNEDSYKVFRLLEQTLEKDLKSTYDNSSWIKKNLSNTTSYVAIKTLTYAHVNGKAIKKPEELVKAAESMLVVVKEIAQSEKTFIEARRNLIKKIQTEKDGTKLDQVWLYNQKQLSVTAVDRCRQRGKSYPALGFDPKKETWPVDLKDTSKSSFNTSPDKSSDGYFEAPSVQNAHNFSRAIRTLLEITAQLIKISRETYVPYWDILEVSYDDMKYGDEIFSYICSAQNNWEVSDLADGVRWMIGHIIAGLYITMFDKYKPQE